MAPLTYLFFCAVALFTTAASGASLPGLEAGSTATPAPVKIQAEVAPQLSVRATKKMHNNKERRCAFSNIDSPNSFDQDGCAPGPIVELPENIMSASTLTTTDVTPADPVPADYGDNNAGSVNSVKRRDARAAPKHVNMRVRRSGRDHDDIYKEVALKSALGAYKDSGFGELPTTATELEEFFQPVANPSNE